MFTIKFSKNEVTGTIGHHTEIVSDGHGITKYLSADVEIDEDVTLSDFLGHISKNELDSKLLFEMIGIPGELIIGEMLNKPDSDGGRKYDSLEFSRHLEIFNSNYGDNFINDLKSFTAMVGDKRYGLTFIPNESLSNVPLRINKEWPVSVLDTDYKEVYKIVVKYEPTLMDVLRSIGDELAFAPLNEDKLARLAEINKALEEDVKPMDDVFKKIKKVLGITDGDK
jgi:hypothetical protein